MQTQRPPWLAALGVSVLGGIGVMVSVAADPFRYLPGHPLGDGPKHVWSYWHAPRTLHTWPWTDALNAPTGGILLDPMTLPALLLSPLAAWGGPAIAANVWVFSMLLLAAMGVARLARVLGASPAGGAVAAALTLIAQPLLAYPVVSGVHERLSVAVLPWLAVALMERARSGRGGWAVALLMAPLALHSGVWAWLATLMLFGALAMPRQVSLRRFGLPWAVGLGLLAGAFVLSRGWSSDPMSLAPQPGRHGLLGPGGAVVRAATPSSLWWPSTPSFSEEGDLLVRGEFLGGTATLLAAAGLLRRRDRWALWWGGCVGLLVCWSLGPWPLGRLNPVWAVSVWVVPLLGAWPEPGQLTIPLVLLVTALAGAAWSSLRSPFLRWGVLVLLLGERLVALPEMTHRVDTRVDPIFSQLPAPGPVVTIPRTLPGRRLTPGTPFLTQMVHEQGIPASVFPGVSRWDDWSPVQTGVASDWSAAVDCLRRGGQRYVALQRDLIEEPEAVEQGLLAAGGVQLAETASWSLIDLGTPAEEGVSIAPFRPLGAAPPPSGWLSPAPLPVGTHTVDRSTQRCPVDGVSRRGSSASG